MMSERERDRWLGPARAELSDAQLAEFDAAVAELAAAYPDPDDRVELEQAMTGALLAITGEGLLREEGCERARLRVELAHQTARVRGMVHVLAASTSERSLADDAGVSRMTVRTWMGKRSWN